MTKGPDSPHVLASQLWQDSLSSTWSSRHQDVPWTLEKMDPLVPISHLELLYLPLPLLLAFWTPVGDPLLLSYDPAPLVAVPPALMAPPLLEAYSDSVGFSMEDLPSLPSPGVVWPPGCTHLFQPTMLQTQLGETCICGVCSTIRTQCLCSQHPWPSATNTSASPTAEGPILMQWFGVILPYSPIIGARSPQTDGYWRLYDMGTR